MSDAKIEWASRMASFLSSTRRRRRARTTNRRPRGHQPRHLEQLEPRRLFVADILISELLASNSGGLRDGDGDTSDWIELYNTTDQAIDLHGYHLSDDISDLTKWTFPADSVIAPHSTVLVFASGKDVAGLIGELHANFRLNAAREYLGLIAPDGTTVVHQYAPDYGEQQTNVSFGVAMASTTQVLVDDDSPMRYLIPSSGADDATWNEPGFDDSTWALASAGIGYESSPGGNNDYTSLIDATVPSNTRTAYTRFAFAVEDAAAFDTLTLSMIYDDGFVAYLNGVFVASASAPSNPAWNSTSAGANRGDDVVLSAYVDFDVTDHLDALRNGDNVLAIHALNQSPSSDMLMIPRLTGSDFGLFEPVITGFFASPTPNAPNGPAYIGLVEDTSFSVDRGFYDSPFDVEITTPTAGASIVYTLDGSAPAVDADLNIINGTPYTSPITITGTTNLRAAAFKPGYLPTNVDTQTYIFTSDVVQQTQQSALAAGWPSSWGNRSADYGLDPDVVGPNDRFGGIYVAAIDESLKAIPSISITLDRDDFVGPSGIYSNVTREGVDWERAASAELIFPDGSTGFQIDAGLRIHGAASRSLSKKNGLRLLFKTQYGDSKLRYPLFGSDGVTEFDTVVLRPHFNDGWGWDGAQGNPLYVRDQWFRDTQAAMGHESSRGFVVHLYVNGQYWGLYNPSERPDASFAAEHFGGDKAEYDVVSHDGLEEGSINAYNTMLSMAQSVNSATNSASKNAAYQLLQGNRPDGTNDVNREKFVDITNYIDYMILNHYGGNNDWPDRNWYANRKSGVDSDGFHFFAWDSEISLALSSRTSIQENNINKSTGAAQLFGILRNYDEFRLQFADRIHEHLFNGGALYVSPTQPQYDPQRLEENVPAARFAELAGGVYEAIVGESARWGDQHVLLPRTRDIDWQNELDYMLGTYFRDRHNIVLNQWRSDGLYPSVDAPELLVNSQRQHGGIVAAGTQLSFLNPNAAGTGTIYFTLDGSDPRLVGGIVNAQSAQVFSQDVTVSTALHVKARVLRNGQWSALTDAQFALPTGDFNSNGTSDGIDLLVWQRGFGIVGNAALSDGDGTGDAKVDHNDLIVWAEQLTANANARSASAPNIERSDPTHLATSSQSRRSTRRVAPTKNQQLSQARDQVFASLGDQLRVISTVMVV
ncbi:MAG: CotH kinase family protein [Pirellulaceae bacterium]